MSGINFCTKLLTRTWKDSPPQCQTIPLTIQDECAHSITVVKYSGFILNPGDLNLKRHPQRWQVHKRNEIRDRNWEQSSKDCEAIFHSPQKFRMRKVKEKYCQLVSITVGNLLDDNIQLAHPKGCDGCACVCVHACSPLLPVWWV